MSHKGKKGLVRIVIAAAAFVVVFAVDGALGLAGRVGGRFGWLLPFFLYLAIYLWIGYDVLWRALRGIVRLQVFDENFLMCVATLGAFALAIFRGVTGQKIEGFDEACAVLLFYQVGEWFQSCATTRSRRSIAQLMQIRPDFARVLRGDAMQEVDPSEVAEGEVVVVDPGERVPLDGVVTEGESELDTKALTGESVPRAVGVGDEALSGCVNLTGRLLLRTTGAYATSTVAKILDMVENASARKSRSERFITRFARFYTPCVVGVALLLAVVGGAVTGAWSSWVYRALSFLVVSCPCALVISIPLSFFAGIGAAGRHGILVKGGDYLEKLHHANLFVFDKTGTLTEGNFVVSEVEPEERRAEILAAASIAEQALNHPIAKAIAAVAPGPIPVCNAITNVAGQGVVADLGDERILCGNEKLLDGAGIAHPPIPRRGGTAVLVARGGVCLGTVFVRDRVKEDAPAVLEALHAKGARTVMLTGDDPGCAASVARQVGVDEYHASLLPGQKVEELERIFAQKAPKDVVCFVGDGINDAPVLTRADVGVAMGGVGSDAAIEASDVVLMRDRLSDLLRAKRIAAKTMAVVTQNIVFSLAIKVAILVLSALGITNMWVAVFGDVGVAVLAILNAMRVGWDARESNKKPKEGNQKEEKGTPQQS